MDSLPGDPSGMPSGMLPSRLQAIVNDFELCEGREKLELLVQYAQSLPPLPDWLESDRQQMDEVPECMTPVHVLAEKSNGKLVFHFDVPPESPTVRGYAALMKAGLDRSTPEEVLQIPADFFYSMGLQSVLTIQRLNGMSAILAHVKQLAVKALV